MMWWWQIKLQFLGSKISTLDPEVPWSMAQINFAFSSVAILSGTEIILASYRWLDAVYIPWYFSVRKWIFFDDINRRFIWIPRNLTIAIWIRLVVIKNKTSAALKISLNMFLVWWENISFSVFLRNSFNVNKVGTQIFADSIFHSSRQRQKRRCHKSNTYLLSNLQIIQPSDVTITKCWTCELRGKVFCI